MQTTTDFNIPFDAEFAFCGHVLANEPKESLERHLNHIGKRFLDKQAEKIGVVEYIYQGYSVSDFQGEEFQRQIDGGYKKITANAVGRR